MDTRTTNRLMLNTIISYSLKHQWRVIAATFAIAAFGVWSFMTMKVDVLPDINKPTVAVFTEAEGFAPEEVERLVLAPVENAVAGAPGPIAAGDLVARERTGGRPVQRRGRRHPLL